MRDLDVNMAANKSGLKLCAAPRPTRVHAITVCDLTIVLFMEKDSTQPTLF